MTFFVLITSLYILERQGKVDWIQGFWFLLWLWMWSAVLCNHCLACAVIYNLDGSDFKLSARAQGLISAVVLRLPVFRSFPELTLWAIPEQVHVKAPLLFGELAVLSLLLEVFVFQSALFMQLENSTRPLENPTSRDPEICRRQISWILSCLVARKRACWRHSFYLEL